MRISCSPGVAEVTQLRKVSIVVVSYNGLHEATRPCLESVFGKTACPEYEVIVVDNHSSDGTVDYLKRMAAREPRLKCVFNAVNRGFAGGNNDGIRAASGDILVLLNNDTLVTEGWLGKIVSALEEDRSIGLAGPVSKSVGNEQRIHTSGRTPGEILAEGEVWAAASRGDKFETDRLGFFCIAMRRDVLDAVGMLDESYGYGFYEDDDYCIRVREAGYRLVCLEDVFVYHRGSATFGKGSPETKALLRRNRALLERKFGVAYLPLHPRDGQFRLLESYLGRMRTAGADEALLFKTGNRMKLLEELRPKGPLKRWRYLRRMKGIASEVSRLRPGRTG